MNTETLMMLVLIIQAVFLLVVVVIDIIFRIINYRMYKRAAREKVLNEYYRIVIKERERNEKI